MLYPFFECVSCHSRVQKVVPCSRGMLPNHVVFNKNVLLSEGFDGEDYVNFCLAQGRRVPVELLSFAHYNFSGCFDGYCCFCALHAGFGEALFVEVSCKKCIQKEEVRKIWSSLYAAQPFVNWRSHGWAALPSSILDKIIQYVVLTPVRDGRVLKME